MDVFNMSESLAGGSGVGSSDANAGGVLDGILRYGLEYSSPLMKGAEVHHVPRPLMHNLKAFQPVNGLVATLREGKSPPAAVCGR